MGTDNIMVSICAAERVFMNELYFCDSSKNTECQKTICLYEGRGCGDMVCFVTEHRKYAQVGDDGKPKIFDWKRSWK